MDKNIDRVVVKLFDEEVLAADGTATSAVVDLTHTHEADFSIQYKFKTAGGTGTAKIEVTESLNGDDWELSGTVIAENLTLVGNASDIVEWTNGLRPAFVKIVITETGKAQGVTLSLWMVTR